MKKFLSEFKTFAMRGNVLDLAVGVVIGGAFGKITTSIVNDLKMMLDETAQMTDEEIKEQIIQIAATYNVKLTDNQINQLISLCRSLEGLDADALKSRVEEVQNTLKKVSDAKTQVIGFVEQVKKVVTCIKSFFEKIGDIIGL